MEITRFVVSPANAIASNKGHETVENVSVKSEIFCLRRLVFVVEVGGFLCDDEMEMVVFDEVNSVLIGLVYCEIKKWEGSEGDLGEVEAV